MKRVTKDMLNHMDEDELLDYINSLEESIEEQTDAENKLNTVLENVLEKYDNFKDPRHLRAGNIMAVNSLIRTKKDMHDALISQKKSLLDAVMKKRDSDAKNKTMLTLGEKEDAIPQNMDFKTFLIHLDNLNINPVLDKDSLKRAESLIDTKKEELSIEARSGITVNEENKEENKEEKVEKDDTPAVIDAEISPIEENKEEKTEEKIEETVKPDVVEAPKSTDIDDLDIDSLLVDDGIKENNNVDSKKSELGGE